MTNPLISIIIPVYNTADYLEQCIESCMTQSYPNIEIITVDDGSTDDSPKILDEFSQKDSRIKVIHKANEGTGLSRNAGMDIANGEWVTFLDSDDFYEPDALQKMAACILEKEFDILLFNYYYYDDLNDYRRQNTVQFKVRDMPEQLNDVVFTYKDVKETLFSLTTGSVGGACFRVSFLKKFNIKSKKLRYTEDALFKWEAVLNDARIFVNKEHLFCYRNMRDGNSYSMRREAFDEKVLDGMLELKHLLESRNLLPELEETYIKYQFSLMMHSYKSLDTLKDYETLAKFFREGGFEKVDLTRENAEKYLSETAIGTYNSIMSGNKPFSPIGRIERIVIEKDKQLIKLNEQKDRNFELRDKNEALKSRNIALREKNSALRDRNKELVAQIDELLKSREYLIGRRVTYIPRKLKQLSQKSKGGNSV